MAKERAAQFQLPPKKKKSPLAKILVPIVLILLILGGGGGFWYFFGNKIAFPCLPIICAPKEPRPQPEPEPPAQPPTPQPQSEAEPEPPAPAPRPQTPTGLIRSDEDGVFEIQNTQQIRSTLSQELAREAPIHSIKRLEFLINEERFASFQEFLNATGISMPQELIQALDGRYTVFRFWQKDGGRIGFVLRVKDFAAAKQAAQAWETSMPEDTQQLFELHGKQSNVGPFRSARWRGVSFRYYDFLPDKLGIVYAFHPEENLFIFTTSGDSMIEVINRIELK